MFICVVSYPADVDTGYLPLRKGQRYTELHRQTDNTRCWSYGRNDDDQYGWIPSDVVSPYPVQISNGIPPPPPPRYRQHNLVSIVGYLDGSTDDRRGIGGAACLTHGSERYELFHFFPGFFVGSAAAELLGALCATQLINENCPKCSSVLMYTDSKRLADYMRGSDPSTAEGEKLLPLITFLRKIVSELPMRIVFEWRGRAENAAHRLARRGIQIGREFNWEISSTPVAWDESLLEVTKRSRNIHGHA